MRYRQIYTPLQCGTEIFSTDDDQLLRETLRLGSVMAHIAL